LQNLIIASAATSCDQIDGHGITSKPASARTMIEEARFSVRSSPDSSRTPGVYVSFSSEKQPRNTTELQHPFDIA
jgi:hypothetical protein